MDYRMLLNILTELRKKNLISEKVNIKDRIIFKEAPPQTKSSQTGDRLSKTTVY